MGSSTKNTAESQDGILIDAVLRATVLFNHSIYVMNNTIHKEDLLCLTQLNVFLITEV